MQYTVCAVVQLGHFFTVPHKVAPVCCQEVFVGPVKDTHCFGLRKGALLLGMLLTTCL
jgi:hypothetical protein